MDTKVCPTDDTLRGYALGHVDDSIAVETECHLEGCSGCQDRLESFLSADDEVVDLLRSLKHDFPSAGCDLGSVTELNSVQLPGAIACLSRSDERLSAIQSGSEYELIDRIGFGGMGEVWRGRHRKLDRIVAIKLLRNDRADDLEHAQRFLREMRTIGRLEHPHVVRATDAGEVEGMLFLVMEFIEGVDASSLVRGLGQIPVREAAEIVRQAALGLEHIHAQGILHRDLKPSNLMLSQDGVVKILDAGLARWQSAEKNEWGLTGTGDLLGTPDYMSPEQWTEPDQVDTASDIYGLGCTLYCLLAGHAPFGTADYGSIGKKMDAHRNASLPDISNLDAGPVRTLLTRMLAKDLTDRPSAAEVASALAEAAQDADLISLVRQADVLVPGQSRNAQAVIETQSRQGSKTQREAQGREAKPRRLLIAAGLCFLAILCGVIVVIRDRNGAETHRFPVPDDGSVEIRNEVKKEIERKVDVGSSLTIVADADLRLEDSPAQDYGLIRKFVGHEQSIRSIVFTPNGDLVSAADDNTVRQWNAATGEELRRFPIPAGGIRHLVISHSGEELYGAGVQHIYRWNLKTAEITMQLQAHQGRIGFLDLASHDKLLLSVGDQGDVKLWDTETEQLLWKLPDHSERVGEVRFNPAMRGEYLLTADIDKLSYWHVPTQRLTSTIPGRRRAIFTPDGQKILTGSLAPGVAYLQKIGSNAELHEFEFRELLRSLAMSHSGKFACAGVHDATLRVWNLERGNEVLRIESPTYCNLEVALADDDRRIAFGGGSNPLGQTPAAKSTGDYAIRLWQLPSALADR